MYVGILDHNIDVVDAYYRLADEDEKAGLYLMQGGYYRHAVYFFIQAMEKSVRAQIFLIAGAQNHNLWGNQKTHSLEATIDVFLGLVPSSIRGQVHSQISQFVIKDTRYGTLHNNLRYPSYSEKHKTFSRLNVRHKDAEEIYQRLTWLRIFLKDLKRLQ